MLPVQTCFALRDTKTQGSAPAKAERDGSTDEPGGKDDDDDGSETTPDADLSPMADEAGNLGAQLARLMDAVRRLEHRQLTAAHTDDADARGQSFVGGGHMPAGGARFARFLSILTRHTNA